MLKPVMLDKEGHLVCRCGCMSFVQEYSKVPSPEHILKWAYESHKNSEVPHKIPYDGTVNLRCPKCSQLITRELIRENIPYTGEVKK